MIGLAQFAPGAPRLAALDSLAVVNGPLGAAGVAALLVWGVLGRGPRSGWLLLAGVIAGVIAITQAQRKVPVQYAQRAVGRKLGA